MIKQAYEEISKINSLDFHEKTVLVIGAGYIAKEYAIALSKLNINNVTILGKSKESLQKFNEFTNFEIIDGGYETNLSKVKKKDLVIIATPIQELVNTTKKVIENSHDTILIEKPGSVFKNDLFELEKLIQKQKVRIAYNRFFYPSFHKLLSLVENDGGITSCKFDFTEWLHTIEVEKYDNDVCNRWGISNSLHVISMVLGLIGMPKEIDTHHSGNLEWHPTGSIFVGSGISQKNIPFSYHANWGGGGRWGIEVITRENIYRLSPLEKLFVSKKGSVEWKEVSLQNAFPNIKEGIAEEIAVMLNDELDKKIGMITLNDAIKFNEIAEVIFGYND